MCSLLHTYVIEIQFIRKAVTKMTGNPFDKKDTLEHIDFANFGKIFFEDTNIIHHKASKPQVDEFEKETQRTLAKIGADLPTYKDNGNSNLANFCNLVESLFNISGGIMSEVLKDKQRLLWFATTYTTPKETRNTKLGNRDIVLTDSELNIIAKSFSDIFGIANRAIDEVIQLQNKVESLESEIKQLQPTQHKNRPITPADIFADDDEEDYTVSARKQNVVLAPHELQSENDRLSTVIANKEKHIEKISNEKKAVDAKCQQLETENKTLAERVKSLENTPQSAVEPSLDGYIKKYTPISDEHFNHIYNQVQSNIKSGAYANGLTKKSYLENFEPYINGELKQSKMYELINEAEMFYAVNQLLNNNVTLTLEALIDYINTNFAVSHTIKNGVRSTSTLTDKSHRSMKQKLTKLNNRSKRLYPNTKGSQLLNDFVLSLKKK